MVITWGLVRSFANASRRASVQVRAPLIHAYYSIRIWEIDRYFFFFFYLFQGNNVILGKIETHVVVNENATYNVQIGCKGSCDVVIGRNPLPRGRSTISTDNNAGAIPFKDS